MKVRLKRLGATAMPTSHRHRWLPKLKSWSYLLMIFFWAKVNNTCVSPPFHKLPQHSEHLNSIENSSKSCIKIMQVVVSAWNTLHHLGLYMSKPLQLEDFNLCSYQPMILAQDKFQYAYAIKDYHFYGLKAGKMLSDVSVVVSQTGRKK